MELWLYYCGSNKNCTFVTTKHHDHTTFGFLIDCDMWACWIFVAKQLTHQSWLQLSFMITIAFTSTIMMFHSLHLCQIKWHNFLKRVMKLHRYTCLYCKSTAYLFLADILSYITVLPRYIVNVNKETDFCNRNRKTIYLNHYTLSLLNIIIFLTLLFSIFSLSQNSWTNDANRSKNASFTRGSRIGSRNPTFASMHSNLISSVSKKQAAGGTERSSIMRQPVQVWHLKVENICFSYFELIFNYVLQATNCLLWLIIKTYYIQCIEVRWVLRSYTELNRWLRRELMNIACWGNRLNLQAGLFGSRLLSMELYNSMTIVDPLRK